MTELSNSLADLAERVKEATEASELAGRTSIEKALEAGRFLMEAKSAARHGEWLPFLERAETPERQAQRFMQLARSGLNPSTVSDLGGLKGALQYLKNRRLPEIGEFMVVSIDDFSRTEDGPMAYVWPDTPGYFHIGMIDVNPEKPEAMVTNSPVSGETRRLENGVYFNEVWASLDRVLSGRTSEMSFGYISDELDVATLQLFEGIRKSGRRVDSLVEARSGDAA